MNTTKGYYPCLFLILLMVIFSVTSHSPAAGQGTITYQGTILAPNQAPPPDGSYTMSFSLWDLESGGSPDTNRKWNETHEGDARVQVVKGVFAVQMGSVKPFPDSLFSANASLWLEISADQDHDGLEAGEIYSPRIPLTAAPYALQSNRAEYATRSVPYDAVVDSTGNGDYTSIRDALNAGKKSIFVARGIYTLDANINITTNSVSIIGESPEKVIIDCNESYGIRALADTDSYYLGTVSIESGSDVVMGTGTDWIGNVTDGQYINLGNVWYQIKHVDSATSLTLSEFFNGSSLVDAYYSIVSRYENLRLENLSICNFNVSWDTAVGWYSVHNGAIENCRFVNNSGKGLYLYYVHNSRVQNNVFEKNDQAMYIYLSSNNTLSGNRIFNNNKGMELYSHCDFNSITNNFCNNNNLTGIYLNNQPENTILIGNSCNYNGENGIWVYMSHKTILQGNSCMYNGENGIKVTSGYGNSFESNICSYNKGAGIHLYKPYNSTLNGNICQYNQDNGIHIEEVSQKIIKWRPIFESLRLRVENI
ncbi:right-handed parallel beta-helix repeat-containing protein [Candidatus Sumerlaeota bacterium]|nr:right-handed parallel beta-helix repeat-containing protein [Candidatus Sumerlaeota bacterium]